MRRHIRIGVIGLGFGLQHIQGFQQCKDVEVAAVCSRTPSTVTKVAQDFGIAHALTDYREMLDMEDLDGVSICTPVYLHHQMALDAIDAGKHVFCEKPLALDQSQAQTMFDRAEQAGIIHMTNFGWRFNASAFQLKTLIDNGYLGRVFHVNARYMMAYRADPAVPFGWRDQRTLGGLGALGDLGVHLIDMIRWWVGDFERVLADMRPLIPERQVAGADDVQKSELDDTCAFLTELEGGVQGVFQVSRCAIRSNYIHIDLYGSHGTLVFRFERETMQAKLLGAQGLHEELREISMPQHMHTPSPQENFIDGIRTGTQVQPSFYEGLRVQQVADALVHSVEQGSWITPNT